MGLSKSDFDKIDERIKSITCQPVEQIEINTDVPPTIDQLEDNNKTYSIMAAILFADIRKSTHLTEISQAKSMVKIYRAFMRMAVDCVRKSGGVTRQFLGDRIMGVFIDSLDNEGNVVELAVDKAINCARAIQTVVDFSLNKHLKNNVNGKIIECGIGIDYGKVLVTKVGMYGVEKDDTKENEVNCVWVGNTTNHASKYSDIAASNEIFISSNVYKKLSQELKQDGIWSLSARYKGNKLYEGYVANSFYLDFYTDLGDAVKVEEDNSVNWDTSKQLAEGIKAIEELINKLIQKEKELAILEQKLIQENQNLTAKINQLSKDNIDIKHKKNVAEEKLMSIAKEYFEFLKKLITNSYLRLNDNYISIISKDTILDMISKIYKIGGMLGLSKDDVTYSIACHLIEIYSFFGAYNLAYDAMVVMARKNTTWVWIKEDVIRWAATQNITFKVYDAIKARLDNYEIYETDKRKEFAGYLEKVKQIRGY